MVLLSFVLLGQSRNALEEKRKALLKQIDQTAAQLKNTQKDKKQTLSRYIYLRNQVQNREQLIETLRSELDLIDQSVERTGLAVEALQHDITDLKKEYANTLRVAYRVKMNHSLLIFLFSASTLNEVIQRWQYIRQYERYRRRQANLIEITQQTLSNKMTDLAERKVEKERLLSVQKGQRTKLGSELSEKNKLLKGLRKDEKQLANQLEEQQKAERELKETIAAVIRKEMESKSLTAANREMNTALVRLSKDFAQNRGALPWPVSRGRVSKPYGTQDHPKLKGVKITNNGIDIRTDPGAKVFAVFSGKVVSSSYIPGYRNTIILRHGNYYSVYSNLEVVSISRGDNIKGGQIIGRVSHDQPEVHFELWEEKRRMNPKQWIRSR